MPKGARGRCHPDWSGGLRKLTCVDDVLLSPEEDQEDVLTWMDGNCLLNTDTGCQEWIGYIDRDGYGVVRLKGTVTSAHRMIWVLLTKQQVAGMSVLHTCDNRKCVNIDHLFLGTQQDNMDDMVSKGRSNTGEKHPKALLTTDQVISIRSSSLSKKELSVVYSVSVHTIDSIKRRKTWKHLK